MQRFFFTVVAAYDGLFGETAEGGLGSTANFGAKWGWYQSIYGLAGGDPTKFKDVTKLSLFQCLTWLEFEKEKNELERRMLKQNTR